MAHDDWREAKLSDIAEIAIGRTPARREPSYWDPDRQSDNPWATIGDMNHKFINDTSEYISDLGVQRTNAKIIPPGTLLMSFKLSLGRVAITSKAMYTNEAIAAIFPKEQADTEFLYYALPSLALEKASIPAVKGLTLNKARLGALKLKLPPLRDQRRIVAILSAIDEVVDKNQDAVDQLQIAKRGLFRELVTRGFPRQEARLKETAIGQVPQDWKVHTIADVAMVITGGTPRRERSEYWGGDIPWMASGEIHQKLVKKTKESITDAGLANSNARWIPKGAVMVALNGQGKTRGAVAILARRMTCNQSLAAIVPRQDTLLPNYLFQYLSTKYAELRRLTGEGARTGLNLNLLRQVRVACPPLPEQRRIADIVASFDSVIERSLAVIDQATVLKRSLTSVLLSGELRVSVGGKES